MTGATRVQSPSVHIIGKTIVDQEGMQTFLDEIRTKWKPKKGRDAESLIEFYGRLCYRSFEIGLNPNVTRIREDQDEYIENILESGHGSIFEAVTVNFVINNCSRVFTHELVRHRVGVHFSQESMRYVRFDQEMGFWLPTVIAEDPWAVAFYQEKWDLMKGWQNELSDHYGIDSMGNFHKKKELTSAFRRLIGDGVATKMGVSMNIRTLRHIAELRTAPGVEEEFVVIASMILEQAKAKWPVFFGDFIETPVKGRSWLPAWVPRWHKI